MTVNHGQHLECGPSGAVTDAALSLLGLGARPVSPLSASEVKVTQSSKIMEIAIVDATSKRKYTKKPKDPKRDTSVSFEEMSRLMRVYGPMKCLRNRSPKGSGKEVKPESIRRKFYRWFPDFHKRFKKTPQGWFAPKVGHQQEMYYREELRKKDKEALMLKKKKTRRVKISDSDSQSS